ncbi:MAG TPA: primosomal protein N' [bacterium]|nr:primosomal protein N' [bacterium]
MIADIIPDKKLPRGLSRLSYAVPKKIEAKIKVGQLVKIPLRQSVVIGVVAALSPSPGFSRFPLKTLIGLVNEKPIFTQTQIQLFSALASYYAVSSSLFVHYSLPKILKKEWSSLLEQSNARSAAKPSSICYFWWSNQKNQLKYYKKLISPYVDQKQILIIVPKIQDIFTLASRLNLNNDQYLAVHSALPRARYLHLWQSALGGQPKIFIGTRSACFLPYTNLKLILVDNEPSPDHKQHDMTPRYEVKKVCTELSQLTQASLVFASSAPSLEYYHELNPRQPKFSFQLDLVDLNYELENKNYTFLSDPLSASIKKTLAQKKQIFLFLNKKGYARINRCVDCGYTFTCPDCSFPLIKEKDNRLICYFCRHTEDFPPFCPRCGGPAFQSLGLGTEKIAARLRQNFPSTSVAVLDSSTPAQNASAEILVGTEFAFDKINWSNIGLAALINTDELWHHAEFRANENAYQLIISLLTSVSKNAKLIIQTFSPSAPLIQALVKNNPRLFYQTELHFREKFLYPPFAHLVKLSIQNPNDLKALSLAQKLRQKLSATDHSLNPSDPFPITRRKNRGQFKYNLILKIKKHKHLPAIIKSLPSDVLIDINPQTLLD